jgi:tricorn protease
LKALLLFSALAWRPLGAPAAPAPAPVPYFSEPAVSPDRQELAFVSGGDIWTVPVAGGEARLLVAHPATESRPLYAPDGRSVAFVSTRTGNGDVYVLTLETGELRRLTFDDAPDQLDNWSADGKWLYYSSTSHDIAGMNDLYRLPAAGGTPTPVSADRYVNEFYAPTGAAWRLRRAALRPASGGATATATWTSPKFGCGARGPGPPPTRP